MSSSAGVLEVPAPRLTEAEAASFAATAFGLEIRGAATPLESERDLNFRLDAGAGGEFVLKISNSAEDPAVLDLQNRALLHVAGCDPDLPIPRLIPTRDGALTTVIEGADGRDHVARVLTYLPGRVLDDAVDGRELMSHLGTTLARLGRALRGFFHPAAGHELLWDLKHAARLRERVHEIPDVAQRALADVYLERFETRALPALPGLRAQVIHNDVSRHNTLVDPDRKRVVGIVDFGDVVHAPLVSDLAVTLAEVMLAASDPVSTAAEVVGAFDGFEPLRAEERALLFDLVAARLAMGVTISAWRVKQHPENREYIVGDDAAHWRLLERLEELEPELRGAFEGAALARSLDAEPT